MKIRFVAHSGFYLELPELNLLFDYYRGPLPEPEPEKPLLVFVSHAHADHFSPRIFALSQRVQRIRYVISDDVPQRDVPEELRSRVSFMGPREQLCFRLPRHEEAGEIIQLPVTREMPAPGGKSSEICIRSFRSTDEGVAYMVDAGGRRIYHAGDLNDWHWDEEDSPWNEAQRRGYETELCAMAELIGRDGHIPDAAFVPLDARLGDGRFFWMGLDEYMKQVGAQHIFPMHLFGDPAVIQKMRELPCAADYAERILGTGTEGEEFII